MLSRQPERACVRPRRHRNPARSSSATVSVRSVQSDFKREHTLRGRLLPMVGGVLAVAGAHRPGPTRLMCRHRPRSRAVGSATPRLRQGGARHRARRRLPDPIWQRCVSSRGSSTGAVGSDDLPAAQHFGHRRRGVGGRDSSRRSAGGRVGATRTTKALNRSRVVAQPSACFAAAIAATGKFRRPSRVVHLGVGRGGHGKAMTVLLTILYGLAAYLVWATTFAGR